MYIKTLKVNNFRTLKDIELRFTSSFNLIIGDNNVGKSNILSFLKKLIIEKSEFQNYDISKINNPQQLIPNYKLTTSVSEYSKVGNDYFASGYSQRINKKIFDEEIGKVKLIYIDIQKEYISLIEEVIEKYNELSQIQKDIFDTQINIDFSEVLGMGNNLLIKENEIFIIDKYADISKIDKKSAGIQRISLLICYINIFKVMEKTDNYILLIDEPESNLHVRAQKKLYELLKVFSEKHQVIISSHSTIFMQDLDLESINYIIRDKNTGTLVDNENIGIENYKKIRDTLGLDISDTLFLNNRIIAVEGPMDVLLHTYIYNRLFPNEFKYTFFTIEGADNSIQNIIALKQVLSREITIILDNDSKGNEVKDKIRNHNYAKESRIIYQPSDKKGELEDMFTKEFISSSILSYLEKRGGNIDKLVVDSETSQLEEYQQRVKEYKFDFFSEVEKITFSESVFNVKGIQFAKHITRELKKKDEKEFREQTRKFYQLYKGLL